MKRYFLIIYFLDIDFLQSGRLLLNLLRDPDHQLQALDISGNEFDSEFFNLMRLALANNKVLRRLDMRRNPGYPEGKTRQ